MNTAALPPTAQDSLSCAGIEQWSVVGHDRLAGQVFRRPGTSDGTTIITSPVLRIRAMGEKRTPVAFTASGSAYRLGTPAAAFGMAQAGHFVWFKSRAGASAPTDVASDSGTAPLKL